jgi:very-short-patch-repair endonuclease
LRRGLIVRPTRGWFALPDADEARLAAARLSGVASHLSAAQLYGWELKWRPAQPTVTVPRNRKVEESRRIGVDVRWRNLAADDVWAAVLRAIALDVPGLNLRPQVVIEEEGFRGRPDLVDVGNRVVLEAESFEFHGRRIGLRRDCERYNALGLRGWLVLRFSWEHVMHEPAYVAECLRMATRGPLGRATPSRNRREAA